MDKTGYVNGSDLLLYVNGMAAGHCTSHTATFNSETKDRAVKPVASAALSSSLWKRKGVVGLGISISADGLRFYDETECGFKTLFGLWKTGTPVLLKCAERESNDPYLQGSFVITNLEETSPAQDDATYKVSFENDGEPDELDESKITLNRLSSPEDDEQNTLQDP